jgi:uncharacterized membrane protein
MSSASPFRRRGSETPLLPGAGRIESLLVGSARFAGFWSAVVLPFALLWLVAAGAAAGQPVLLAALLAVNLLALRLGRDYNRN